jgi:hypothetical protein
MRKSINAYRIFVRKSERMRPLLKPMVVGRFILKLFLNNMKKCRLDLYNTGQEYAAVFYGYGNEYWGCVKCAEYVE